MSIQWWIYTNSTRSQGELLEFLRSFPDAAPSSEFKSPGLVEFRGHALAKICKPRRGAAISNVDSFGFIETVHVMINRVRNSNTTHLKETIYEIAIRFSDWEDTADIWFSENEVGIFKRIEGRFVVNMRKYENESLQSWLPRDFDRAITPEAALRTAEQSDEPKSRS